MGFLRVIKTTPFCKPSQWGGPCGSTQSFLSQVAVVSWGLRQPNFPAPFSVSKALT